LLDFNKGKYLPGCFHIFFLNNFLCWFYKLFYTFMIECQKYKNLD